MSFTETTAAQAASRSGLQVLPRESVMPSSIVRFAALAGVAGAALLLAGCEESHLRLAPDFGVAVRQDVAGQVADPDAQYAGVPAPASNGSRVSLAQTRYNTGKVIQPASTSTSQVSTGGGSGGGGGGGPQ
jgi:hypothetical protein